MDAGMPAGIEPAHAVLRKPAGRHAHNEQRAVTSPKIASYVLSKLKQIAETQAMR